MTCAISRVLRIPYRAKTSSAVATIPARNPGTFRSPPGHSRINASPNDAMGCSVC